MADKIVCTNRKAYHDYKVDSVMEVGMVLNGAEVKSLRAGKANLRDSYALIKDSAVYLYNFHISTYSFATQDAPNPLRVRKLLLHRREIRKLLGKVKEKGFALIPLKIYFNKRGKAKLELALAKGKKLFDKRTDLKKKESDREIERAYKKDR